MFIFHKTEVQTVILRCLMGLNLNWLKSYDKECKYFHFPFLRLCKKQSFAFFAFCVISFKPSKIQTYSVLQNDGLNLRFVKDINTSYLTDSYIGFTLKMESVTKSTIFGLKMIMKSGLEKFILKSLHAGR